MPANRLFPSIIEPAVTGVVDLAADAMMIQLVTGYTFDAADVTLADVVSGDRIGALTALAGTRSWASTVLSTDDTSQVIPAVYGAGPISGWLYVLDGATDADRRLVGLVARSADTTPISRVPNGSDVTLTLPGGRLISFAGGT
jgi:hypothetical protein